MEVVLQPIGNNAQAVARHLPAVEGVIKAEWLAAHEPESGATQQADDARLHSPVESVDSHRLRDGRNDAIEVIRIRCFRV